MKELGQHGNSNGAFLVFGDGLEPVTFLALKCSGTQYSIFYAVDRHLAWLWNLDVHMSK